MRLTEEQRKLVEENHNLIYGFLNQYKLDDEDFYDLASIGLCKAAMKYDVDKKKKFSTLAYTCMNNEVRRYYRDCENVKKRISKHLVSSYNIELEDNKEILDVFIKDDDFSEDSLIYLDFDNFKKTLKDKERIVVEYLESGFNMMETAKMLGRTHQYVSLTKKEVLRKWSKFYNRS